MKIKPFILTQVREKQNELVMNLEPFDKQKLSESLYSFWGAWEKELAFFRCFRVQRDEIVAAYYWRTTRTEQDSGRDGLYVIIGFIMSDCNYNYFMTYCNNYFNELEKRFGISMEDTICDALFDQLQGDANEKLNALHASCKPVIPEFSDKWLFSEFRLRRLFFRSQRRKKQGADLSYLYMMNSSPDFYTRWSVFMNEAFKMLRRQGYSDISSLEKYTVNSLMLLKNGDKIPEEITSAKVRKYRKEKYLVLS